MMEVIKYESVYKKDWDELVARSRNGTFLFYRDFLEYHKGKYTDCSFLFYKRNKLVAAIAGNVEGKTYHSHGYLTYGGFIVDNNVKTTGMVELFMLLNQQLLHMQISEVVYKPVPLIYQQVPTQEDLYVLFRLKAKRIACDISSVIYQNNKINFSNSRKNGIRKAKKNGLQVLESDDYDEFWNILEANLKNRYQTLPIHTIMEISFLKTQFPKNIKLFVVKREGNIIGGTVLFLTGKVIHVQYIAANKEGKTTGALDLLFYELLNNICNSYDVFDFGKSTEKYGEILNENLIFQKEGFGARGVVYETYSYRL